MSRGTIDIDEFENATEDGFAGRNDTERIVLFGSIESAEGTGFTVSKPV